MGGQNFSYEDIFGGGGGFADIFSEIFGGGFGGFGGLVAVEAAEVVQTYVVVRTFSIG